MSGAVESSLAWVEFAALPKPQMKAMVVSEFNHPSLGGIH